MTSDPVRHDDVDRAARDWLLRVQLGDTSGPGESAGAHAQTLAAFEVWRAADPDHAAAYERVQRTLQLTDSWAASRLLASSQIRRLPFHQRHPVLTSALAASLVAAVGLGIYQARRDEHSGVVPPGPAVAEASVDTMYVSRVGETRQIALPDGSSVLLDTDSQLRVNFGVGERWLRLDRGRARFTVAHDAARPFAVDAGDGRVIAHGTIFDVAVSAKGVHVALLRGAIEVQQRTRREASAESPPSRNLAPGQQLSFVPTAPLPAPHPVQSGELDWVSGRLSFRDAPLADAVVEINRYNARRIVLATQLLGELRVSGGYDARAPETFASAVARLLNLTVQSQPDGTLLLRPIGTATTP